ncbi:predicted protein [Arabidopsis lyrata subsp. lyrata]|uniref:HECT-type E3 ubiquitin transferase n=1 Tax=Arabidopsis lyrata subsp. lyrata TaxID=81972 RepID=D7KC86_ARALL|nr:predicted protein [Arabidopsis lyrata subsp. lyrata]
MNTSYFKLSKPLEERMDKVARIRDKYPERFPVIVEKSGESDVPDIDKHKFLVPANLNAGEFVSVLRKQMKLRDQTEIFVFFKNTLMTPTTALMSEIYEKHKDEDGFLYMTYSGEDILCAAKTSLRIADSLTQEHPSGAILLESLPETWRPLLSTLEKLVSMSESDKEFKKRFEEILKRWTDAFCSLLICVSTKEDIPWVMKLKELTNFYVRNHLVQSLFPRLLLQIEDDVEDHQLQVVVSRTSLFKDSLNQVMAADPWDFHAGISIQFEYEEAEGDGVLREWLCLVCNNLFDPENKLFIPSPDDSRRFSPHPNPLMEENYLQKYRFSGRIISMALKHEMQVGILFDPLFFLHLAGKKLFSWKDLIHTDKELHKKYKEMLEMDAQEFDALQGYGLTFSGLCYDNDNRQVTSSNREEYITLIMHDRYFLRIRDQVLHFSYGVEDMIDEGVKADRFFSLLKLEDLDSMLRGSQYDVINVEDWNQYTDYVNYQRSDNVILWFWNVVSQMNQEDLHRLLCFWTSHRFLPRDGFQGLPRLSILRMDTPKESKNLYKPQSQTCCYSLRLPDYDTYKHTERAIMWITHEYTGFGEA